MSQVTIYLPEAIAARARREAKRQGVSLSAYIAALLERRTAKGSGWSKEFLDTFGAWKGDFPEVEDLPAERREALD